MMFGIDEDIGDEMQDVSDWPKQAHCDLLQAVELMLRAGKRSK